MPKNDVKIA